MNETTFQQGSRDHHYIPAFYLRKWCVDGKLYTFSRPHSELRDRRISVKGVGYERDLYALPSLPAPTQTILEDVLLKAIDQRASNALDAILAGSIGELGDSDKLAWGHFILSLHHRHPEKVRSLRQTWTEGYKKRLQDLCAEAALLNDPSSDQIRDDQGFGMLFNRINLSESVVAYLLGMQWFCFISNEWCYPFLTCDQPLIRTQDLRLASSYLMFPVSPNTLFVAVNTSDFAKQVRRMEPRKLIADINDDICIRATRFVFSNSPSQKQFISNRLARTKNSHSPR